MMTDSEGHTLSADRSAARERLSALADGELDDAEVTRACLQWRGDAELRSSWHAYQLIGDVLRSDDLGASPMHDADFLAALRLRLADEPVVLAPAARIEAPPGAASAPPRRRAWMTPAAVAAGFVAVVGAVFVTRAPDNVATPPALAAAGSGAGGAVAVSAAPSLPSLSAADPQALAARGRLIRDVRLDRYLSAHKEFAGSSALGVPSGYLRNATAEAVDR